MTQPLELGDHRVPERLWRKIEVASSGCWLWTASQNSNGYGRTTRTKSRTTVMVHRYMYELLVGTIAEGLQLDHLCRVRHCCNPAHVEPVTQRTNLLRGETLTAAGAAATHCPQRHPYDGANLYVTPRGERRCRECHRLRQAARRAADPTAARVMARQHDAAYRARRRAS